MSYAEQTNVPFEKSIADIITLIKRAGAGQIGQMEDAGRFVIGFKLADRAIKFVLPLETEYRGPTKAGNGRAIDPKKVIEQRNRSKGRALLLVIKAKLEGVESGIETVEQAFLANVVTLGGATVYERVSGDLALEYNTGQVSPVAGLLGGQRP